MRVKVSQRDTVTGCLVDGTNRCNIRPSNFTFEAIHHYLSASQEKNKTGEREKLTVDMPRTRNLEKLKLILHEAQRLPLLLGGEDLI